MAATAETTPSEPNPAAASVAETENAEDEEMTQEMEIWKQRVQSLNEKENFDDKVLIAYTWDAVTSVNLNISMVRY